jgi:hypothetical protein
MGALLGWAACQIWREERARLQDELKWAARDAVSDLEHRVRQGLDERFGPPSPPPASSAA